MPLRAETLARCGAIAFAAAMAGLALFVMLPRPRVPPGLGGGAGAIPGPAPRAWAAGGLVVGLAFFVKQPGTTFAVLVPVVLAACGRTRRALWFAGGAVVGLVPLYLVLQAKTGGWFAFYCLTVPSAHGVAGRYVT